MNYNAQLIGKLCGLETPQAEFRFHPVRLWRFDFAWPALKIALEVDGGAWSGGRHTRGKGFIADQDKTNAAMSLGWAVFRTTPDRLYKRELGELVRAAADLREGWHLRISPMNVCAKL
jgi:very-short-patch-repair endonuclease